MRTGAPKKLRRSAFLDKSAWLLILPAIGILALTDIAMLRTLLTWTAYAMVMAGLSVMVSRIVFPQIDLTDLVVRSRDGNISSAIVAAALILFLGLLFMSFVMWVKA